MSKSQLPNARDLVMIYRLIGECRDLGHDSVAWRRHFLSELLQHVGGLVATSAEYHNCFGPAPFAVGDIDLGWLDEADRTYRERHIAECGFNADPHFERLVRMHEQHPGLITANRVECVEDREWYLSAHFNEFRRPTRNDSSIYAACPLVQRKPDVLFAYSLTRGVEEKQFSERDRRVCHWILHELQPLLGKQLALPGEPSLSELPRRLRQTLECLLQGDSEKQAAVRLGLSPSTVHDYVKQLYRRFDVNSRAELLARWLRFDRRP